MVAARRDLARRAGAVAGRILGRLAVFVVVGGLVLLAAADAVGRLRLVPAPSRTTGTAYVRSDVIIVEPVSVQRLRVGDVVIVHNKQEHALFRVAQIVDSEGPQVRFAEDALGRVRKLGGTAWRVRLAIPILGGVLGLLAGPIQGIVFVVAGFALVVRAEVKRGREGPHRRAPSEPAAA